jgi:Cu(I)/Ag(I) efflux system membrane fusion protein
MKRRYRILILLLIAACFFLAGYWVNHNSGGHKTTEARRILHYVDPMNPAFKSDKPGIAPCGMPLEPVYADKYGFAADGHDSRVFMPPGTIRIPIEKQQLIGVKVMTVEKAPWNHTLRVLGRVTPDETRIYRINAAINGWIVEALPVTTGSLVKKDQLLATFYSLEYRSLLSSYFSLISSGRSGAPGSKVEEPTTRPSVAQLKQMRDTIRNLGQSTNTSQADYYKMNLFNYGMSEYQLEEIERTRKIPEVIEIRAPVGGFILSRNVSPGLRFDRGAEFVRIADLSNVWILADVFENEASFFKPGTRVKMELPYQKKTLYARMSHVLPQFDPATRTLKVRLEANNPGYAMRPDMFVNVELPVSGPPAIIVPVDAVLDSGLKKTVFVDRGNGLFEPRQVETGRSLGERVEIVRGLMPGEKIVVSGNFLIDSEARMQKAAAGITGKISRDPVCGMDIDEDSARAAGNYLEYRGQTYFFCEPKEREDFRKEPERYLRSSPAAGNVPAAKPQGSPKIKHTAQDAATGQGFHDHTKALKSQGAAPTPMSHDHTPMPMPDNMKVMPPTKGGVTKPGSGSSIVTSGPQGPDPMPGAKTEGVFPPLSPGTDFKSVPKMSMPVPGATPIPGPAMQPTPGLQGPTTVSEPATERPVRSTSRPPRRGGARPSNVTVMPGPQEVPAVPQPKTNGMIPPGTGTSPADQQKRNTSNGENAHD